MFSIKQLVGDQLLDVPPEDNSMSLRQLKGGERFPDRGGVYTFYNEYHEPLYVGITVSLYKRIPEHLQSAKGNIDLVNYINSGRDGYVSVFYEGSKRYQEIYESYLIAKLSPRFNVAKTDRRKVWHE